MLFLLVQLTALVGAAAWARPTDRRGPRLVVQTTLVQWAIVTVLALYAWVVLDDIEAREPNPLIVNVTAPLLALLGAAFAYYVLDQPEIGDDEYDALYRELLDTAALLAMQPLPAGHRETDHRFTVCDEERSQSVQAKNGCEAEAHRRPRRRPVPGAPQAGVREPDASPRLQAQGLSRDDPQRAADDRPPLWPLQGPLRAGAGGGLVMLALYGHPFSSFTWKALIPLSLVLILAAAAWVLYAPEALWP